MNPGFVGCDVVGDRLQSGLLTSMQAVPGFQIFCLGALNFGYQGFAASSIEIRLTSFEGILKRRWRRFAS